MCSIIRELDEREDCLDLERFIELIVYSSGIISLEFANDVLIDISRLNLSLPISIYTENEE
jgi:hypothetical protein